MAHRKKPTARTRKEYAGPAALPFRPSGDFKVARPARTGGKPPGPAWANNHQLEDCLA